VESRLAQTGSGVLVTETQRGSYDLPVFGSSSSAEQNAQPNRRSENQRLEELKELREDGLITEEEYDEKRDDILEEL
jgi:hypothetical protein